MHSTDPKIIVALDFADQKAALDFVTKLDPSLCRLKVGKQLFTLLGPAFVRELIARGFSVFLDLKFHDIPNTVSDACLAAAQLGVWMVDVHVSGGRAMLQAARRAIDILPKKQRPSLIGVTVLTSLDQQDLLAIGIQDSIENAVLRLAQLASECRLDGVVCSPQEITLLRAALGQNFLLVTPGIRLTTDKQDDQKRTMTPESAFQAGADYLVIGRSITHAQDPAQVLRKIIKGEFRKVRNSC